MYAVVKTGGKQYRVSKDDTILVEKLDAQEGETVTLSDVIMLGDGGNVTIGKPKVANAAVEARVVSQTRGPKIIIFRRKRRKNHRRTQGHRQDLTLLKVTDILTSAKAPAAKKAAPAKAKSEDKPAETKSSQKSAGSEKGPGSEKAAPKKTAKKAAAKKA